MQTYRFSAAPQDADELSQLSSSAHKKRGYQRFAVSSVFQKEALGGRLNRLLHRNRI